LAEHAPPQLMPVGLDVTVPDPLPSFATARTYWTGGAATTV
jgi:hypothetical protein